MNKIFLSLILIFISFKLVHAKVVVATRGENQEITKKAVSLSGLYDSRLLEDDYFRVVRKNTEHVISVDSQGENIESLRAQTVYFHLTKARLYFEKLGITQKDKLTIRIDIEDNYHKKYHYQAASKEKVFNNAHTYQPGDNWGHEIWFRSPKEEDFSDAYLRSRREQLRSLGPSFRAIDKEYIINLLLYTGLSHNPSSYLNYSAQKTGTDFMITALAKYITPEVILLLYYDDSYFLDAAMIPEVSYHEYAHYIVSDYLPPIVNTPIMEGLSDYYATKIAKYHKLSHKLGEYGQEVYEKVADDTIVYDSSFDNYSEESSLPKGAAFVLKTLQEVDSYTSKKEGEDFAPALFFKMRKDLNINSKIQTDLTNAVLNNLPPRYKLGVLTKLHNLNL